MESAPKSSRTKALGRIAAATVAGAILLWGLTYGRWEYLSYRHGTEMERVAVFEFEAAQLPIITIMRADDIAQIKVLAYNAESAKIFLKDQIGNKWLMGLLRRPDGSSWTAYHDGGWQIEMIHSTMGGGPRRAWYWY